MNKPDQAPTETVGLANATKKANHAAASRPVLVLTWSLDPTTGKPLAYWVVRAGHVAVATAA
jgi:hypothetical protein